MAEVIKYGLIRDAALFQWLEDNMEALIGRDPSALAYAIKRSCENKVGREAGDVIGLEIGCIFWYVLDCFVGKLSGFGPMRYDDRKGGDCGVGRERRGRGDPCHTESGSHLWARGGDWPRLRDMAAWRSCGLGHGNGR